VSAFQDHVQNKCFLKIKNEVLALNILFLPDKWYVLHPLFDTGRKLTTSSSKRKEFVQNLVLFAKADDWQSNKDAALLFVRNSFGNPEVCLSSGNCHFSCNAATQQTTNCRHMQHRTTYICNMSSCSEDKCYRHGLCNATSVSKHCYSNSPNTSSGGFI
jgi:hypothetical protein